MGDDQTIFVDLDVQTSERKGYTKVEAQASGGLFPSAPPLWYRFTGGNTTEKNGDIDLTVGDGPKTVCVTKTSGSTWGELVTAFAGEQRETDQADGLQASGSKGDVAIFVDPDLSEGAGNYGVMFLHSVIVDGTEYMFQYRCDPRWVNRPT